MTQKKQEYQGELHKAGIASLVESTDFKVATMKQKRLSEEFALELPKKKICHWSYFVKIVAAPSDAFVEGGVWYEADGTEIGPVIWGSFAIIQEVESDPCAGIHGAQYISPAGPGLGKWER